MKQHAAQLHLANDATALLLEELQCVTFAAPMAFARPDRSFTNEKRQLRQGETLKWLAKHSTNFVNNNDIVPRLPRYMEFAGKLTGVPSNLFPQSRHAPICL